MVALTFESIPVTLILLPPANEVWGKVMLCTFQMIEDNKRDFIYYWNLLIKTCKRGPIDWFPGKAEIQLHWLN